MIGVIPPKNCTCPTSHRITSDTHQFYCPIAVELREIRKIKEI